VYESQSSNSGVHVQLDIQSRSERRYYPRAYLPGLPEGSRVLQKWIGTTSKKDCVLSGDSLSENLLESKQVEKICVHNIPEGGV
jgi:hypothetical protein